MANRKQAILVLVILVLASLVAACTSGGQPDQPDLVGTRWTLSSLNGGSLIEDTEITLYFEETYLGGKMTCNGYGGTRDTGKYTAASDGTLSIDQLAVTVQLCSEPEGIMEQEKSYIEAFLDAATYRVFEERLEIADASGNVTLVYTRIEYDTSPSLEGTEWVLTSLGGSGLIQGTRITLIFEETYLGGKMTCNGYGGGPDSGKHAATEDGTLTIPQLAVTLQECSSPKGVMEQEATYIEALHNAATYRVIDHQLEIADASGNVMLVYTRFESAM
jgi:heat shock protein HslJ